MTGEGAIRIGLGVDAHALEEGVPLVLGGVRVESARGLAGHSDGDVITHALIDALLGAANLGDIGSLFPSDGSTPPGVSSLVLLEDVYATRPRRRLAARQRRLRLHRRGASAGAASRRDAGGARGALGVRRRPDHRSSDDDGRARFHRPRRGARRPGRRVDSSGLESTAPHRILEPVESQIELLRRVVEPLVHARDRSLQGGERARPCAGRRSSSPPAAPSDRRPGSAGAGPGGAPPIGAGTTTGSSAACRAGRPAVMV